MVGSLSGAAGIFAGVATLIGTGAFVPAVMVGVGTAFCAAACGWMGGIAGAAAGGLVGSLGGSNGAIGGAALGMTAGALMGWFGGAIGAYNFGNDLIDVVQQPAQHQIIDGALSLQQSGQSLSGPPIIIVAPKPHMA